MPDLTHHRGKIWDKKTGQTIDERARGLAGISCLCAEENLLKLPSDKHADHRAICVHEFAHIVHRHGLDTRGVRFSVIFGAFSVGFQFILADFW